MLSGDEAVGVPWVVTLAFVRLLTHPTICIHPLGVSEVRRRVEHWFEHDHVRLLSPGPVTLQHFFALLEEAGTGGNLSTDAMIAAHALEHAAVVHTADLDFGRFSKVRWVRPLAER